MTKLYVAAIAMVWAGCAGGIETDAPLAALGQRLELDPPDCHAILPALIKWPDTAKRAPVPPPQTQAGVVLVTDSFAEPDTLWAFASDDGKLTAWVAFPRRRLGELALQVNTPLTSKQFQLAGSGSGSNDQRFVAKLAMVKVPVPVDPRMPPDAILISEIARFELVVVAQAIERTQLCVPPPEG